jgi:hypothetical protein
MAYMCWIITAHCAINSIAVSRCVAETPNSTGGAKKRRVAKAKLKLPSQTMYYLADGIKLPACSVVF